MNSLHPGIKFKDLQQLGRDIELNLPPIYSEVLIKKLATISTENEHNKSVAIGDFIEKCCHYEPKNSQEFVAYVKIAASIELLKVHSMHIRAQKSRLTDHTYAHNLDFWTQDTEKVKIVAEAIWMVTSDISNLMHLTMIIAGFNEFTFNVSLVLMSAEFNKIMQTSTRSGKVMKMVPVTDAINFFIEKYPYEKINNRKLFYDFLTIFQMYQKMVLLDRRHPQINMEIKEYFICCCEEFDALKTFLIDLGQHIHKSIVQNKINNESDSKLNQNIVHIIDNVVEDLNKIIQSVDNEVTSKSETFENGIQVPG